MSATWLRGKMKECFSPRPCLSVSLSICHLSVCLSVCVSVYPSVICLSVYPFVICLSIYLSCLSVCLSVFVCPCQSVSVSLSVYVCLSVSLCLFVPLSVCVCLSVCLWVNVCKVTLCELYLCCTGWECGLLTVWPCSSLQWPGDFLAYIQVKKSLAIVKEKCKILTTVHKGAKGIDLNLLWWIWKWEISWPSSVSLRTFKTLILICRSACY